MVIICLPGSLWFIVSEPAVQTYLTHRISSVLSAKLGTKVSVESVDFKLFNRFIINGVYISDLKQDTLLSANKIDIGLNYFSLRKNTFHFGNIELDGLTFKLKQDAQGHLNLQFILNAFKSKKNPKAVRPLLITARSLHINNLSYVMKLDKKHHFNPEGMNYYDLEVRRLSIDAHHLTLDDGLLTADLRKLTLHEKCGFNIKQLSGQLTLSSKGIRLNDFMLIDDFSRIRAKYYAMEHASFRSYRTYVKDVCMKAELDRAEVDFRTIGFFAPRLKHWPLHFKDISGIYTGPVADMHGKNIRMTYGDSTKLNADFAIVGLAKTDSTRFTFHVKQLDSKPEIVEEICKNFHVPTESFIPYLKQSGPFTLKADYEGFYYKFNGKLEFNSSRLGALRADINYDHRNEHRIEANLESGMFELGKLLQNKWIGQIAFRTNTWGKLYSESGNVLNSTIELDSIKLGQSWIRDMSLHATLVDKVVSFESAMADPNLKMSLEGTAEWGASLPEALLKISIPYCDLRALRLRSSQDSSILNAESIVRLRGNRLDNLDGELTVSKLSWKEGKKAMHSEYISLKAENSEGSGYIQFRSDFGKAEVSCLKPLSQLWPSLSCMLNHYVPNLGISKCTTDIPWSWGTFPDSTEQNRSVRDLHHVANPDYVLSFYLTNPKDLPEFFLDGLSIADSTGGRLAWNQGNGTAMLRILSPKIQLGGQIAEQSTLTLNAVKDSAVCLTSSNSLILGGLLFKDLNTSHLITSNKIRSLLNYQNDAELKNSGRLAFETNFLPPALGERQYQIGILPSYVVINSDVWSIPQSALHLHGKTISIKDISVVNGQQHLEVTGSYSSSNLDTMKIRVEDFRLNNFNSLAPGMKLDGKLSGYAHIMRSGNLPIFVTKIVGKDLKMDNAPIGDLHLLSQWNNTFDRLDVLLNTQNKGKDEFTFLGNINPSKNNQIQGKGTFNGTRLSLVKPFVTGIFSQIKGRANGQFLISGNLQKPLINGKVALDSSALTLAFTHTTYLFHDTLHIVNNDLFLRDVSLTDGQKGKGIMNVVASRIAYPEFSYHISIDPRNMACIDLKETDNKPVFGNAYASGIVSISGNTQKCLIKILATTDENTSISIPLQNAPGSNENSFVQFKKKKTLVLNTNNSRIYDPQRKHDIKKITHPFDFGMEMQIAATPEAEVRLVIDQHTGDAIEAVGKGNIKMEMYPSRDIFKLFGSYVIERGEYTFSVQNFINKRFKIEPNSRINFNGNIADATLNINTTYKLRASLGELLGDTTERYSKKVPIDCIVSMSGKLTAPTLKFSIDAPNTDLETRGRMKSALNTEEKTVQQFVYLLVMNQFMNAQQSQGILNNVNAVATAGVTIGEMISGALSNIVANTFKNVDLNIGVNYRVNGANQTDWEVNFSTNITDRVSLSGNVDMPGGNQNKYGAANNNEVTGDIDIEVRLDKTGNVKLKAFSHSKDQYTDDLGTARHGLGIFYQKDFNSFKDLFRRKHKKQQSTK